MQVTEWKWNSKDGLEMYSKAWMPSGEAKAVICLLHGLGEHLGRYEEDGAIFSEAGYVLAGFDQRGHGKSGGSRGHVASPEVYFDDIDSFLTQVIDKFPGKLRFIYGLSMGGIQALAYTPVRKPKVAGVITSAAALRSALQEQKVKVFLAKVLGRVLPTVTMDSGLNPEWLSRDPKVIEAYVKDPMVHRTVSFGWGKTMLALIQIAWENAGRFPVPLLLIHGSEDVLGYASGSAAFGELAPKERVTVKIWEGYKHEMRNDPEKGPVFDFLIDWLNSHGMDGAGAGGS